MEYQLRERQLLEVVPVRKYKLRRRKVLSLDEQKDIANSYLVELRSQKEIAQKFRVTRQLVKDLVAEAKHNPKKRLKAIRKEKEVAERLNAVKESVQVF